MTSTGSTMDVNGRLRRGMVRRFVQVLIQVSLQALILFGSAGTVRWAWGWAFTGLYLLMVVGNGYFLVRRSPETIVERGQAPRNWKVWDKVVGLLFALVYFVGVLALAGLDRRFGWTGGLALGWHVLGGALFVLGATLFGWAMVENAYFSTVVRIQDDRGQAVCTTGPYRFVRHPGYVGGIVEALGQPLLLGSLWALIPGVFAALLLTIRTALEDRTLREELPGYEAFTHQTRYRLIPGVW